MNFTLLDFHVCLTLSMTSDHGSLGLPPSEVRQVHNGKCYSQGQLALCMSDVLTVTYDGSGEGKPLVQRAGEYCTLQRETDLLAMDGQIKIKQSRQEPENPFRRQTVGLWRMAGCWFCLYFCIFP